MISSDDLVKDPSVEVKEKNLYYLVLFLFFFCSFSLGKRATSWGKRLCVRKVTDALHNKFPSDASLHHGPMIFLGKKGMP